MPDLASRAHSRTASNSFRISMSAPGSSRFSPSPPRKPRKHSPGAGRRLSDTANGVGSWLLGKNSRLGVRRWVIVLAAIGGLALWTSVGHSSASGVGGREGWFGNRRPVVDLEEIPEVDRSALEKLRLLEIHYGADEDDEDGGSAGEVLRRPKSRLRLPPDGDAPPVVANIPDVVRADPTAPVRLSKVPADILDSEFCPSRNGGQCAFLVPAWLGEQETKAQMHLYQLGLLALSLNRTLVLPNVAKSRLSCCYPNPFSFYYAADALSALGIPTISQSDFIEWSERRDPPASAQVVSIVGAKKDYTAGAIEIDSASDPTLVPNKPTRNLCLKAPKTRLDFTGHSPLAIYPPEGYHRNEGTRLGFGESVVNTLSSAEVGSKSSRDSPSLSAPYELPNVLAFNYELRFSFMGPAVVGLFSPPETPLPLPFAHFPYADTWTTLAERLAESLGPSIAVHWRTETLASGSLVPCAASLLVALGQLAKEYPEIKTVYLATDYPFDDPLVAHSGTFSKVVTEQHHTAFRALLKGWGKDLKGLRLTSFEREQKLGLPWLPEGLQSVLANTTTGVVGAPSEGGEAVVGETEVTEAGAPAGLEDLDAGLMGIIDKAIAMRAEVFLTGYAGVGKEAAGSCAKVSSFTEQIIAAREKRRAAEESGEEETRETGRLWNSVTRWSVKNGGGLVRE